MSCFIFFFFFCIIVTRSAWLPNNGEPYICSDSGNYTSNSTYGINLKSLLTSMSSDTEIDYGFYNFSAGEGPDRVHAIALCSGDVSPEVCRSCVNASSHYLLQSCPNQKEAIVWYNKCMLRYSNRSIFGVFEAKPNLILTNNADVSDIQGFNQVLISLLDSLRERAASGNSTRKFAAGRAPAPAFQTIRALLVCTPDLDYQECNNCLGTLEGSIAGCCNGKQGGKYMFPSCNLRFETYEFYDSAAEGPAPPPPTPPPPPVPPASPPPLQLLPPPEGKERNSTPPLIVIVVPTAVSIVLITCIITSISFLCLKVRKARDKVENEAVDETISAKPFQLDFGTIKVATENFSDANKLGEGGFGAVYKGTLPNGQKVAVKRLRTRSDQGDLEFKNEVQLVARLQHRNLVRLIGFCLEGNERLLIYEFVLNGSLDRFIFDPTKSVFLDWKRRFKIIEGIARGILYLHEDSQLRIVHRDLKPSNILLDVDMKPKISDFGTVKLFALDQSQDRTKRIAGTHGYMPPEYVMFGRYSLKSDVFSFGVLVLETISGKRINSFPCEESEEGLLSHAWKSWKAGAALDFVDPTLRASSATKILRCIHIGLLCVQENATERPTVASILLMLSGDSVTLSVPKKPAFLMSQGMSSGGQHNTNEIRSFQNGRSFGKASTNEASISELYPR